MAESWSLQWSHGRTRVHAGGGAIGATEFRLPDGRWVSPFHEAPWITRGESIKDPGLKNLRGDWPCLPFGRLYDASDRLPEPWATAAAQELAPEHGSLDPSDRLLHGYGANSDWQLVSNTADSLVIAIDYPTDSPIRRLTRSIKPVAGRAAMDVSVEILARRDCARPFGFHPNFALRGPVGSFRIEPGRFRFGLTHPAETGVTEALPNARFQALGAVPLKGGGTGRFDRLPFSGNREEILQLCGIEDGIRLVDEQAQVVWTLAWDGRQLPSCLLWMSNRGRLFPPWNGENLCVGVEPVASAFDLGCAVATARNPISAEGIGTALRFRADQAVSVGYTISAEPISLAAPG